MSGDDRDEVREKISFLEELLGGDPSDLFVFVLDSSGNLRTMMVPEDYDGGAAPDSVQHIMDMFNLNNYSRPTLH